MSATMQRFNLCNIVSHQCEQCEFSLHLVRILRKHKHVHGARTEIARLLPPCRAFVSSCPFLIAFDRQHTLRQ